MAGDPEPSRRERRPRRRARVVLGVCGGIAAYKAVEVCRRLVDAGVHVTPVLTEEATRFVGAVTFSALASEPVQRSLWDEASPIPHTRLGQQADLVVVVPATAHTLARYAAGLSDDLLMATLLATRAPVLVCPGHAHRDVGAPVGAGEPGHARAARRRGRPARDAGGWPAATRARAGWPTRRVIVARGASNGSGADRRRRDLARPARSW